MTQQLTIDETDAATDALPYPAALQEINIFSHSTLLYWWPADRGSVPDPPHMQDGGELGGKSWTNHVPT
jgi:hypothetical protein